MNCPGICSRKSEQAKKVKFKYVQLYAFVWTRHAVRFSINLGADLLEIGVLFAFLMQKLAPFALWRLKQ